MKNNELLELIKETGATRKFQDKTISVQILKKIVIAGIWGPSVLAVQPWEYTIVCNRNVIKAIGKICFDCKVVLPTFAVKILQITANILNQSSSLVVIHNNARLSSRVKQYGDQYIKYIQNAETLSIGASIQNMCLMIKKYNLGAVWLDSPCIVQKEINELLGIDLEMVSILAIGYPDVKIKRSYRRKKIEDIKIVN